MEVSEIANYLAEDDRSCGLEKPTVPACRANCFCRSQLNILRKGNKNVDEFSRTNDYTIVYIYATRSYTLISAGEIIQNVGILIPVTHLIQLK